MRQEVAPGAQNGALFRQNAVRASAERLFGTVTVAMPPSSRATLLAGLAALLALGCVAWLVEIPQRARAVGVLMPPGGFVDVVADAPARVARVDVDDGQVVAAGSPLVALASDRPEMVSLELASLRNEVELLDGASARQATVDAGLAKSLADQVITLERQLAAARAEFGLRNQQVSLLERRLRRIGGLADAGNISLDALEREQGQLIEARAVNASLSRTIMRFEQELARVSQARAELQEETERNRLLHARERGRLQRRIEEQSYLLGHEVLAQNAGTVARVLVRPGKTVRPGDALVRMYRGAGALEAWLYLPSSKAAFLEAGQTVQIRLDGYPHQLFGTRRAVVRSVSETAIVPGELAVPLLLDGPVFEVRATLDARHVDAWAKAWQLTPGASFEADLVQRRYRLYEWLLRAVVQGSGSDRA